MLGVVTGYGIPQPQLENDCSRFPNGRRTDVARRRQTLHKHLYSHRMYRIISCNRDYFVNQ